MGLEGSAGLTLAAAACVFARARAPRPLSRAARPLCPQTARRLAAVQRLHQGSAKVRIFRFCSPARAHRMHARACPARWLAAAPRPAPAHSRPSSPTPHSLPRSPSVPSPAWCCKDRRPVGWCVCGRGLRGFGSLSTSASFQRAGGRQCQRQRQPPSVATGKLLWAGRSVFYGFKYGKSFLGGRSPASALGQQLHRRQVAFTRFWAGGRQLHQLNYSTCRRQVRSCAAPRVGFSLCRDEGRLRRASASSVCSWAPTCFLASRRRAVQAAWGTVACLRVRRLGVRPCRSPPRHRPLPRASD